MMSMRRGRRGVSEVVATLALVAITLAAMAIYVQAFNTYFAGETGLLTGIFRMGAEQNYERISIAYLFQNDTQLEGASLYVALYNYGARNSTVVKVVIDTDTLEYTPSTINTGELVLLRLNQTVSVGSVHVISVITEKNNVVSTQFRL